MSGISDAVPFTDLGEALNDLGYGGGSTTRELMNAGLSIRRRREAPPASKRGDRKNEIAKAKAMRRTRADVRLKRELEALGVLGPVNLVCWGRSILHADGNADYVGLLGWNGMSSRDTPDAREARVDLAFHLRRHGWTVRRMHSVFGRACLAVMRALRARLSLSV